MNDEVNMENAIFRKRIKAASQFVFLVWDLVAVTQNPNGFIRATHIHLRYLLSYALHTLLAVLLRRTYSVFSLHLLRLIRETKPSELEWQTIQLDKL